MAAPNPQSQPTQAEQIREVFRSEGPMTIERLADRCIELGIFDIDRFNAIRQVARKRCRDALTDADLAGLPFAGPAASTGSTGPQLYKQRTLWELDDYKRNIAARVENDVLANARVVIGLRDECLQRFQYRYPLPRIRGWN